MILYSVFVFLSVTLYIMHLFDKNPRACVCMCMQSKYFTGGGSVSSTEEIVLTVYPPDVKTFVAKLHLQSALEGELPCALC